METVLKWIFEILFWVADNIFYFLICKRTNNNHSGISAYLLHFKLLSFSEVPLPKKSFIINQNIVLVVIHSIINIRFCRNLYQVSNSFEIKKLQATLNGEL